MAALPIIGAGGVLLGNLSASDLRTITEENLDVNSMRRISLLHKLHESFLV